MANYGGYGYQYETSPKKLQPEYVPTKKAKKKTNVKPQNTKKPSKQQKNKYNYKPVVYIGLAFVMLFSISYRYSLINEEYNSKENIKSKVSAVQKENEQLKVSIENSLNLSSIEKAAQDKLLKSGLGSMDSSGIIKWSDSFKSSADAAKAWGISVEAAEVAMHNLESYGAEFDGITFNAEELENYKS